MSFPKQRWMAWSAAAVIGGSLAAPVNAALIVDLRATAATGSLALTDSKSLSYTPAQGAGSATLQIWAVVTGTAGNSALEGFQFAYGGFRSSNLPNATTGGTVRGTLAATLVSPFLEGSGPTAGSNNDVDGDTDLDVGSTNSNNAAGWLYARNNEVVTASNALSKGLTFNSLADGGIEVLLGTLTFNNLSAVAGATSGDATQLNWFGRTDGSTFASYQYLQDGATVFATTGSVISGGVPVSINLNAVPEPGTLALGGMTLAGLAGWKLRRRQSRS